MILQIINNDLSDLTKEYIINQFPGAEIDFYKSEDECYYTKSKLNKYDILISSNHVIIKYKDNTTYMSYNKLIDAIAIVKDHCYLFLQEYVD